MTVAAGLEYMYSKPGIAPAVKSIHCDHDCDADENYGSNECFNLLDDSEEMDANAREEAGADWMVEQGFDRKD